MEVIDNFVGQASLLYENFLALFPGESVLLFNVLIFIIFIAIVSLFIWQFYKSTSRRNLISLNLNQYNKYQHPVLNKIFATFLYLVEYIIIMPIMITLWFVALAAVLLLIAEERSPSQILFISAGLLGAIRILAYHKNEIAQDVAKLFPFMALSLFLLSPTIFNVETVLTKITEIPALLGHAFYFILAIVLIEIVLRLFYTIFMFSKSEDKREEQIIGG